MKGQLIGEGNTAEVYAWGDTQILKLFRNDFPREGMEREYNVCMELNGTNIPIPKVDQMVEIEGRKGIVYEKIMGESMLKLMMTRPLASKKYARQLAKIHYQVHQCKVEGLYGYKEVMKWNICKCVLLAEEAKKVVLAILEQLPEGNVLCHGDFHPGNIMIASKQPFILDWMTAATGNPCADVARTLLLLQDGALPSGLPKSAVYLLNALRHRMGEQYLKEYIQLSGKSKEEIVRWRIPIAAARLIEWIPDSEKDALLKEVKEAIGQ